MASRISRDPIYCLRKPRPPVGFEKCNELHGRHQYAIRVKYTAASPSQFTSSLPTLYIWMHGCLSVWGRNKIQCTFFNLVEARPTTSSFKYLSETAYLNPVLPSVHRKAPESVLAYFVVWLSGKPLMLSVTKLKAVTGLKVTHQPFVSTEEFRNVRTRPMLWKQRLVVREQVCAGSMAKNDLVKLVIKYSNHVENIGRLKRQ